ncbi:MAG TPA: hypothetical protein DCY06_11440 [Bacteroidetes bacterium]|nr:hypothetical protein [Bacteroidota bacterium]HRF67535.1 hypothetical protein [Ignavibacteria bacterium]HRJ84670.1 hypothetical protein [Ignavibacteria bacterium]
MKSLKILILASALLYQLSYSQENKNECGTWDAVIISIEKFNDSFLVTGKNFMPDCVTSSGIYFEWSADKECVKELALGMRLDFDKFKPIKGYWRYNKMFTEHVKNSHERER